MQKKSKDKLTPLTFEARGKDTARRRDAATEAFFEAVKPAPAPAARPKSTAAAPVVASNGSQSSGLRPAKADKRARAASDLPSWAGAVYWIAVPLAALWAGCMFAFAANFRSPLGAFEYRPYAAVAFASVCLLPAVFILLAAYAVRQAAKLSVETGRARALAGDIAIPAALAADQAGGAAYAVRREVERVTAAAAAAEQQFLDLRRALSEESDRLIEAAGEAERRAEALTQGLAREREEMTGLTDVLDAKVQTVSDAIAAQSRMVMEASDLAATQIQEAEAALAARATDLATAAGEAGEAAQIATDVLGDQIQRLEAAGETVATRIDDAQVAFSDAHIRLFTLAESLRADQEHITAQIDAQRTQLLAASADARSGAEDITEASSQSADALRALIASVAEQVERLAVTAEADQLAMSEQAQSNLKVFSGAVAEERAALEAETRAAIEALATAAADTRQAAIAQTEAARERVEQLGETAFALSNQADQAFEAHIASAQHKIEQSASLVEAAGLRSAERIEAGLGATQSALQALQSLLGDIDAKVAAMPDDARVRAETVRQAVEQGIGDLTAAARRAAEETQAIDAAFQSRIKHNYEVLSEALRLMGRVAGAADVTARASTPTPAPLSIPKAKPAPPPILNATLPETEQSIRVPPEALSPGSLLAPSAAPANAADAVGLRPRLKLTVDAPSRPDVRRPLPQTAAASPSVAPETSRDGGNEWTWKDLLSSIDEAPMDDEVLAERLISEIEALGLDASTLLPLARIDEIAAVMQAGDVAGARDVVRNLAPSAVRRLSRRVLTDKVLRAHADRYLQRYEDLLIDSAKRDRDGFVTATLLGSDPGRAFLLFNAAVGELH